MRCLLCPDCRTYFQDAANRPLLSALFGEHENDDAETWRREPDLSRLYDAYHALDADPLRGLAELQELAQIGSEMSMMYLGNAFATGNGATVDLAQAAIWFGRL